MRNIVSYDDITLPYGQDVSPEPVATVVNGPPPKKQKTAKHKKQNTQQSRELTRDEVWDDSALIDAWEAATEEYEIYHGPDKDWKKEPVKKSPLWYNIPPSKPEDVVTEEWDGADAIPTNALDDDDSRPVNFDTFMPTHDPSLFSSAQPSFSAPGASDHAITLDEAFNKALQATYWSGYWTAMYHSQRRNEMATKGIPEDQDGEGDIKAETSSSAESGPFL